MFRVPDRNVPGDAFVVRGFARTSSGGSTLGGGRVLDAHPPRRRRSDPVLLAELTELAGEGAGVIKWNPTQLLPHSVTMTSNVTKHITYGFQGKRVRSTIVTRRTLTITDPEQ